MAKMKIAVVTKQGGDFEIQEREIRQPGPGRNGALRAVAGDFINCVQGKVTGISYDGGLRANERRGGVSQWCRRWARATGW